MTDAFRDAELCSAALDQALTGARPFDEAMVEYQQARDQQVLPIFEFTTQLATLEPPSPELQHVLGAVNGNQSAMDDFVSVTAGSISPSEFFAPPNIERIMTAAAA